MRIKNLQRTAAFLLCVLLCLGTAYAADVEQIVSGIAIEIMLPSDWASTSADAKICVTDETGGGFASVEVRIDRSGSWRDITASMERQASRYYGTVTITANCTVYVRVTGYDGAVYENSRYMECFDTTPPTLRASVSGNVLRVEAADDLSGVAQITVNGKNYTNLTGGAVDIPLADLGTSQQITVQAADYAGNDSQVYSVANPNDQSPASSQSIQSQNTTASAPAASTPVKTSASTAPSTAASSAAAPTSDSDIAATDTEQSSTALTPDGQGTVVDDVTDQDGKEFFTFTTPSDNTFYLVIDKQRESENVYFLNAVTESDLLALAEKDEEQEDNSVSAIPDPEPVCTCKDKCAAGEVNTACPVCVLSWKDCTGTAPAAESDPDPEPEAPKESNSSAMVLVLISALAVGGAGYYLKIYKPKHDLDDAEDFDELTGEDEETVNEDDWDQGPHDEPEEPDYPEGYGYGEAEDGE